MNSLPTSDANEKVTKFLARFTADDYMFGMPYQQAKEQCQDYSEYQLFCDAIDAEGYRLGVDTQILSMHHSTFERYYYRNEVLRDRLGENSKRIVVPVHNGGFGYPPGISAFPFLIEIQKVEQPDLE